MAVVCADKRTKRELVSLHHFNPALCMIVDKVAIKVKELTASDLYIKCIYRTQAENDKIYESECIKKKLTAHGVWAAVDLRSRGLEAHIETLLKFINKYNATNANKTRDGQTAIFHEVKGHGPHFHVQYQERKNSLHRRHKAK